MIKPQLHKLQTLPRYHCDYNVIVGQLPTASKSLVSLMSVQEKKASGTKPSIHHMVSCHIGRKINNMTPAVAKSAPPSRLCATIFCCSLRKCLSLTRILRSKIIKRDSSLMISHLLGSEDLVSSNLSQGSGWRRENKRRKKQLPLSPDRIKLKPSHHNGQAANVSHRVCAPR